MKFTLLTHEKELSRADNTGALVDQLGDCKTNRIRWNRTQPDTSLVEAINTGKAILLTQDGDGEQLEDISDVEHVIILDGTWQEARKIYNKSGYLKQAKWFCLDSAPPSRYNLRRNQVEGGLCTAECAIEVLKIKGMDKSVTQLDGMFEQLLGAARRNQQ
jgi:DTW domain-containing protein YfiP